MDDKQRPPKIIRQYPPCKDCTERFIACGDRCPKDERGEYGYKAWKADIAEVNKKRKEYDKLRISERKRQNWALNK